MPLPFDFMDADDFFKNAQSDAAIREERTDLCKVMNITSEQWFKELNEILVAMGDELKKHGCSEYDLVSKASEGKGFTESQLRFVVQIVKCFKGLDKDPTQFFQDYYRILYERELQKKQKKK